MARVLIVHTGGTLAMASNLGEPLRPSDFVRTVRERIPELGKVEQVTFDLFSNVDSSEIQPETWEALASRIAARWEGFDGCVVTHGTDTMAETAAALSFMLQNPRCPVVVTGAMLPLRHPRTDARQNLLDAVTCAVRGPREIGVCFNARLFRGNRVLKVSSVRFDAFDSPNFPPLGELGTDIRFAVPNARRANFRFRGGIEPRVGVLRVHPGLDVGLARLMLARVRGVVVEAFGSGNFPASSENPRSLVPFFDEAQARRLPVVVVSQAAHGGVALRSYAAGDAAHARGVIDGGDMTPQAAMVKLMHGLGNYRGAQLRAYLGRPVAGEMSQPG